MLIEERCDNFVHVVDREDLCPASAEYVPSLTVLGCQTDDKRDLESGGSGNGRSKASPLRFALAELVQQYDVDPRNDRFLNPANSRFEGAVIEAAPAGAVSEVLGDGYLAATGEILQHHVAAAAPWALDI